MIHKQKASFKFNFFELQKQSNKLLTAKEKINFWRQKKANYLNSLSGWSPINPNITVHSFDKKCDIEIESLEDLLSMESKMYKSQFKLSEKTGAKTDLIRVLSALFELKMFTNVDANKKLIKEDFMKEAGEFFGTNLSNYHANLSQAFNEQPLETNLKIFEDMKNITQKKHYTSQEKQTKKQ